MFGRKFLAEQKLEARIKALNDLDKAEIDAYKTLKNMTVDCEGCGCLIRKELAIRGKSEIRVYPSGYRKAVLYGTLTTETEYIYVPFYCKKCAPKEKVK